MNREGSDALNACGIVYGEFDENVHVIEPRKLPDEWQSGISIDPGLNNPLAALWFYVDYDDTVYVAAEHFEAGRNISYHAEKIKNICEKLNWKKDKAGRIYALIDSAANQKTLNGPASVAQLFFEQGIAVDTRVNKDLFTGIARVKEYFKGKRLYIFKNCVNLIRDHALDALRYYIMTRPAGPKLTEKLTAVQKDKERLMRKIKRRGV